MTFSESPLDRTVQRLTAGLEPVRKLRAPGLRAATWLSIVVAAGLALASIADVDAVADRLAGTGDLALSSVGSVLTTALAAVATLKLATPDGAPGWALLPLPALGLWLSGSIASGARTWGVPPDLGDAAPDVRVCFTLIVAFSLPLALVLARMVRRGFPLRPGLTSVVGGLTAAAGGATLLAIVHPYDATARDIAVHAAAVGLVVAANALLADRLWRAAGDRRTSW